jgi:hypothetical protein
MVQANAINFYSPAKWVVSTVAGEGTHTTIATAITSASAGDTIFIMPGTFIENLSLKAGVNLTSYTCDGIFFGNVVINGTLTATYTGIVNISGINLENTNSANVITCSGSNATSLNLINCEVIVTTATGISLSNANATLDLLHCVGVNFTNTNAFFDVSAGTLNLFFLYHDTNNIGTSTISGGTVSIRYSTIAFAITTSSTGVLNMLYVNMGLGVTCITHGASSSNNILSECRFSGGSSSAISVSVNATLTLTLCDVSSTNTNAITGAGTIVISGIAFSGSSSVINTTTQNANFMNLGKWKSQNQPAFLAILPTQVSNVTGDGTVFTLGTTTALTKIFDQANNFATGTFTAPVTGRYMLTCAVAVGGVVAGLVNVTVSMVTSNRTYLIYTANAANVANNFGSIQITGSVLADLDAADTYTVTLSVTGGSKVVDILSTTEGASTMMSGFLMG